VSQYAVGVTPQPPARRRNPALIVLDVVAGIVLLAVGAVLAIGVISSAIAYGGLHAECGDGPHGGLACNSTALGIVVYGLIAVAILALFLGFGMFLVSLVRKRLAFYWPLAAIVITIVLFYAGTWVAGMTVP
jgi:O-antigen ligase